ncbi:MAG: hydroxyacid dehydrogenase [Kordiimonadales bacterium]|nr:MAG: hydroxyacid dehydrogenase [Kordiimonadales bacterium]
MISREHIEALGRICGPKGSTTDPDVLAPHLSEWRDKFTGKTALMLMPQTAAEAAAAVAYCNDHSIALVPQGGNTGLVGGSLPGLGKADEILVSTKRMSRIVTVDADNYSITAEAGCTVAALQAAAEAENRLFPLSLASEGSCTVGGIVSTNAGGVHVVRYGNTRALTLGIEAILPDGSIYDGLTSLRKDNTGYALDQLLIGAEGTLGLVTRATFKLYPKEVERHTLWLGVNSVKDALSLLSSAREATGDRVSVFELMPHTGLEFVLNHIPDTRNPLDTAHLWYLLIDIGTSAPDTALKTAIENWVETALSNGLVQNGAIATSGKQASAFWQLRESMSEAQKHEGASIKHDISVPVSNVPAFIEEATATLEKTYSGVRVTPFGHLGDGNLHFNVMQPKGADKTEFLAHWEAMNELVHDIVINYGGSISAEHGIGSLKKAELARTKPKAALTAMKSIKQALDPKGIMNPNVLFE